MKKLMLLNLLFCLLFSFSAFAKEEYQSIEFELDSTVLKTDITYPFFENAILQELNIANNKFVMERFQENYAEAFGFFNEQFSFIKENFLQKSGKLDEYDRQFELNISYNLAQANDNLVSIVWNVYSFTGGAHGNIDLISKNYDIKSKKYLSFNDIFPKTEEALLLLSKISSQYIDAKGYEVNASGLEPIIDNFSTFTLHENFLRIHFQAYQIAPWSAGLITADIPYTELKSIINNKYFN